MHLRTVERPDPEERERIAVPLRASNRRLMPRLIDAHEWAIFIEDDDGQIVGGLWAEHLFDWVYLDLIFVPETVRGEGIGRELLQRAETRAEEWGVLGLWLGTFGFQARGFYEKCGYECFATLPGRTGGEDQYFMRKPLKAIS